MTTLYVSTDGAVVRLTDERLMVTKDRAVLMEMPLHKLDSVVVFQNVTVTPAALQAMAARRIDLCFTNYAGRFFGRLQPPDSAHVRLRRAQYRALDDQPLRLKIARGIVFGKLANQRTILLRARRADNVSPERIARLTEAIVQLRQASRGARFANSLEVLRGYEGEGASAYFRVFDELLLNSAFTFTGRKRQPAPDPVNAMLGFGYAMLAKDAISAAAIVGLDPYAGFLHGERYNQPSLGLDLMEEFRPLIVDATVLALINRRQISPDGFTEQLGGAILMNETTRKTFLQGYEERKRTEVRHPQLNSNTMYSRMIELQARIIAKVLLGELDNYVPFIPK
ncbi:MAG: CRISPR-associated endonuclease Cas1 [Acidobacteriota bacterium]